MSYQDIIVDKIISGEFSSPTKYDDKHYINFKITGVGNSIRDEQTYLRPETEFLCDNFYKDCIGIPITFNHPYDENTNNTITNTYLNTDNYKEFIIGNIIRAYELDNEVWGIGVIYDDRIIPMLSEISTSPAISVLTENINNIIVEKYVKINHVALVKSGHWDDSEKPSIKVSDLMDVNFKTIGGNQMDKDKVKEETIEEIEDTEKTIDEDKAKVDEGAGFREADRKDENVKKKETAAERKEDEGTGFRDTKDYEKKAEEKPKTLFDEDGEDIESKYKNLVTEHMELMEQHNAILENQKSMAEKIEALESAINSKDMEEEEAVYDMENEEEIETVQKDLIDCNIRSGTVDNLLTIPVAKKREKSIDYLGRSVSMNKSKIDNKYSSIIKLCDSKKISESDRGLLLEALGTAKSSLSIVKNNIKTKGIHKGYNDKGQEVVYGVL